MTDSASQSLVERLPELPDDHSDLTPELALKVIGKYRELMAAQSARITELEAELREANRSWNERCVTTSINAYGWMRAHDKLLWFMQSRPELSAALMVSGPNIKYPSPEDAPELLQRALAAESDLARVRDELDASNNNHRAMAHQMAELGARCKHAESEVSRVEGETIERCAKVVGEPINGVEIHRFVVGGQTLTDHRGRELFIAKDDVNLIIFELAAKLRSLPPLAKRGEQKSRERSNPPAEQSPTEPQPLTEN